MKTIPWRPIISLYNNHRPSQVHITSQIKAQPSTQIVPKNLLRLGHRLVANFNFVNVSQSSIEFYQIALAQFTTKPTSPTLSLNAKIILKHSSQTYRLSIVLPNNMLGKKFGSMKKLAKKVRVVGTNSPDPSHHECLLRDNVNEPSSPTMTTPPGTFVVYVGEERERFVVPTGYLSHPLFKILLEKAYNEFGFNQRNGLVVPCSVAAFHEVIGVVECCNGRFDFRDLVEELI